MKEKDSVLQRRILWEGKVMCYKDVFYKKERLYVTKAYIKEGKCIL
jgi:hypothetical protein